MSQLRLLAQALRSSAHVSSYRKGTLTDTSSTQIAMADNTSVGRVMAAISYPAPTTIEPACGTSRHKSEYEQSNSKQPYI